MAPEADAEKITRLERRVQKLTAENERLRRENQRLQQLLEQAAPFSRRHPKAHPAKPGHKAGPTYGRRCRRPIPVRIDETIEVPLPARCPLCGGGVGARLGTAREPRRFEPGAGAVGAQGDAHLWCAGHPHSRRPQRDPGRDGMESGRTIVVDVGLLQRRGDGVRHSAWARV